MLIKFIISILAIFLISFSPNSNDSIRTYNSETNKLKILLGPPTITPETLHKFMFKDINQFKSILNSKGFILDREETLDESISDQAVYSAFYSKGDQKITVTSEPNRNGISKIISIKSTNDDSYLMVGEFPIETARYRNKYISETRHIDLLVAYGFKIHPKDARNEDGERTLYKGSHDRDDYIECTFFMDGEFETEMEFSTSGD